MATYLEIANRLAAYLKCAVRRDSDRHGVTLVVTASKRRFPETAVTFPPVADPATAKWLPGSRVSFARKAEIGLSVPGHKTALKPLMDAAREIGTWASLAEVSDAGQTIRRVERINAALGVELLDWRLGYNLNRQGIETLLPAGTNPFGCGLNPWEWADSTVEDRPEAEMLAAMTQVRDLILAGPAPENAGKFRLPSCPQELLNPTFAAHQAKARAQAPSPDGYNEGWFTGHSD